jgi:hypothetical protein
VLAFNSCVDKSGRAVVADPDLAGGDPHDLRG